ncbi:MAG: LysM protein [Pseudomonas sp.]|nr:LysM protein [Pseudomonas sp.]
MLKSSQAVRVRADRPSRQIVRRWCVAAATASFFYSALASALGLGDITLHSALEQPFNADIELVDTAGLSAEDIHVGLASPEAFSRAGVDRLFFFNDLRFTTVIHGNRGVVHVVSRKPVSEPYLSFLVRLARPNGDLVHTYTLLLDPPDSPQGRAAARGRWVAPPAHSAPDVNMPVAPPQAVQGNHYTVVSGDNLASIARRLQGQGGKTSVAELAKGIQALNAQAFPQGESTHLRAGQSLLLPDTAVVPVSAVPLPPVSSPVSSPGTSTPAVAALSAEDQKTAEQLASNAIENQQLSKSVDDLKGQLHGLEQQVSGKDKQVVELQTALAELKAKAAAPAPAPVASPVAAAPAVPVPEDDSFVSMPLLLGAVLVLLLLLGLAYSVRRNKRKNTPDLAVQDLPERRTPIVPTVPVYDAPRVVAAPVAPVAAAAPVTPRIAGAATDALDGASIYIAYGRISEALGILRDASAKQPQRTDLRLRILELLAEQGDVEGFAREEQILLEQGMSADTLQAIRDRYPQLLNKPTPVQIPLPVAPTVVAAAAAAIVEAQPAPVPPVAKVETPVEPVPSQQPDDEFHLNLDDLSMDADWDLVDPFETTPVRSKKSSESTLSEEPEPDFASNLTQFPEVYEMPDEQFLSDFAEPDPIVQSNSDSLDDEFLDSFLNDSEELDLLDLSEEPLSKLNQAQVLIDDGDWEEARVLLQEVIDEADEEHQRAAKDLLAGIS